MITISDVGKQNGKGTVLGPSNGQLVLENNNYDSQCGTEID